MTEKIEVKEGDSEETPKVEPTLEPEVEPTVEEPKSEPEPKEVTKMTESKEVKFSEDDLKILKEAKESMVKQAQKKEREDMLKEITEDLKKSFGFAKVENKVMFAKDVEVKELVEYKEALQNKDVSIDRQFKVAGKLAEKLGLFESDMKDKGIITDRRHKEFICNGTKLEMKGLGVTTNQNTDTDYLLSGAELHDVMDPVIYNALNEATVFWNVLSKEDFSMKGNNQVQWVSKYSANSTAGAYLGNSVDTSNTSRLKVQTKFKKYQAGVMVDGDMIAAARGGPFGDIFTVEVRDATETLLSKINIALFAEVGLETVAGIIGLEYIADSAGNTTMYNLTRSSYSDWLAPATAGDTYINGSSADISLANMRSLKRNAFKRGSQVKDLIYVTDHIQGDKIRGIYDASQRNVPTISRWGFEGMLSFDGIPIFEDKDCNDDDMFLVDLKHHKVAIWVPPTLEMLGKDSDSIKGFIKTYFAVYNTLPCTVGMIYANATT